MKKGDCSTLALRAENPAQNDLLEQVLSRENLIRALRQVERNGGSPGIDGMRVKELRSYLKDNWLSIRDALIRGTYRPQPVRRVEIPKPDGGMRKLSSHISDRRVLRLINCYLRSGVLVGGILEATVEGTPQGEPLSPLLANILLDSFDRELERRGLRFVRYADDSNIYVRSRRSAKRVLKTISRYLSRCLKLQVNESKSAVGRPWERQFLGFSFTTTRRRCLSVKVLKQIKAKVRQLTRRTRGRKISDVIRELRLYLKGWIGYYGFIEIRSILKELDSWIRRKLRCYLLKQWSRGSYRELRRRGVSRSLAWNTIKSAHGPWRLSRSPALSIALPGRYFDDMGLPRLYAKRLNQPNRLGT